MEAASTPSPAPTAPSEPGASGWQQAPTPPESRGSKGRCGNRTEYSCRTKLEHSEPPRWNFQDGFRELNSTDRYNYAGFAVPAVFGSATGLQSPNRRSMTGRLSAHSRQTATTDAEDTVCWGGIDPEVVRKLQSNPAALRVLQLMRKPAKQAKLDASPAQFEVPTNVPLPSSASGS